MGIKHAFTNPKADGGDATITRPSDWNANHVIDSVLATATASDGSDTTLVSTVAIADVDARLAVTFTTPASGLVIVTIEGWMQIVSGYTAFHVIREGSTQQTSVITDHRDNTYTRYDPYVPFFGGGNQSGRKMAAWMFMLSSGSHTLKWSTYTDGGGASQVKTGPSFGDAIIKVVGI